MLFVKHYAPNHLLTPILHTRTHWEPQSIINKKARSGISPAHSQGGEKEGGKEWKRTKICGPGGDFEKRKKERKRKQVVPREGIEPSTFRGGGAGRIQGPLTLWSVVGSGRISNSTKILCVSSLPASMKRICSRTAKKKWQHRFPIISLWSFFFDAQGPLTLQSVVGSGRMSNSSELSCITVSIKRIGWKPSVKKWQHQFLDAQGQVTLWSRVGSGRISKSSKLLCTSSLPESMKRIRSKTAEKKWQDRFFPLFYYGIISDPQGQLTPQSAVESRRISISSELSCMSLLPSSMKRIVWKTAENKSAADKHDIPPQKITTL